MSEEQYSLVKIWTHTSTPPSQTHLRYRSTLCIHTKFVKSISRQFGMIWKSLVTELKNQWLSVPAKVISIVLFSENSSTSLGPANLLLSQEKMILAQPPLFHLWGDNAFYCGLSHFYIWRCYCLDIFGQYITSFVFIAFGCLIFPAWDFH